MNIIDLEKEVELEANTRSMEVFNRLLDKIDKELRVQNLSLSQRLHAYVSLKIARHHLRKQFFDCFGQGSTMSFEQFDNQIILLNEKIKKARQYYYAAKRNERSY